MSLAAGLSLPPPIPRPVSVRWDDYRSARLDPFKHNAGVDRRGVPLCGNMVKRHDDDRSHTTPGVITLRSADNGATVTVSPGTAIELSLDCRSGARFADPHTGKPDVVAVTAVRRDDRGNLSARLQAINSGQARISVVEQPLRVVSRTRVLRVWGITVRVTPENAVGGLSPRN
jgi:hypothetical protein